MLFLFLWNKMYILFYELNKTTFILAVRWKRVDCFYLSGISEAIVVSCWNLKYFFLSWNFFPCKIEWYVTNHPPLQLFFHGNLLWRIYSLYHKCLVKCLQICASFSEKFTMTQTKNYLFGYVSREPGQKVLLNFSLLNNLVHVIDKLLILYYEHRTDKYQNV